MSRDGGHLGFAIIPKRQKLYSKIINVQFTAYNNNNSYTS